MCNIYASHTLQYTRREQNQSKEKEVTVVARVTVQQQQQPWTRAIDMLYIYDCTRYGFIEKYLMVATALQILHTSTNHYYTILILLLPRIQCTTTFFLCLLSLHLVRELREREREKRSSIAYHRVYIAFFFFLHTRTASLSDITGWQLP